MATEINLNWVPCIQFHRLTIHSLELRDGVGTPPAMQPSTNFESNELGHSTQTLWDSRGPCLTSCPGCSVGGREVRGSEPENHL